jgi:acetyl-CoA C-acetyltransferase
MTAVIIGIGHTKFGELWNSSLYDLLKEAGLQALEDAELERKDINEVYVGNMGMELFEYQTNFPSMIYQEFFSSYDVSIYRVEAACASGGVALNQAFKAVEVDEDKIVMVGGVEKMTDARTDKVAEILSSAAHELERIYGATFPGLYALKATRYLHETDAKPDDFHMVAVKNHANACYNENAHYRRKITLGDVRKSRYVAKPLRLLDCSSISDGAACVILTSEKKAKELGADYVKILSCEVAHEAPLFAENDILELSSVRRACKRTYKKARVEPNQIDVAEVHDAFTIAEILELEALGFAKPKEGYKILRESLDYESVPKAPSPYLINGREVYFNTSGGLKAKGHPVGATGVSQIVEIVKQLKGECGKRQVKDAEKGLALNIGGTGGTAVVSVLEV